MFQQKQKVEQAKEINRNTFKNAFTLVFYKTSFKKIEEFLNVRIKTDSTHLIWLPCEKLL